MRPEVMEILSRSLTEHIQQNARNKLSTEYLLANDARLCANFTDNIMNIGNMCIQDGGNAVGLVVGNSYIHSILPELKLRGVLICDVNNDVLEYSHYLTSCILQSSKYDTFEAQKQYILGRILSEEKNPFFSKKFKEDFQREVESLKDLHFLASQQRLELCRTWLAQSQCVCLNVNLAEYEQVRKIGEILKNHHVSIIFLNMTNLRDYVPRLSENLKTLPIAKKLFSYGPLFRQFPVFHYHKTNS
jgi:hypothetical protein